MSTCPSCGAPQTDGLLCHTDTTRLENTLRAIPELVRELDVTLSKQAKIGQAGKAGKGSAHTKTPIHLGALQQSAELTHTLVAWARHIVGDNGLPLTSATSAAKILLFFVDTIRRHTDAAKLLDEITDAARQARHTIDKPAERVFVGPCLYEDAGTTCHVDLYAKPDASHVTCSGCEMTHDVAERRAWLLQEASDRLVTVKEASQYLGEIGGIRITQAAIRGYLHRGNLTYRPGHKLIRLGDLLELLTARAATGAVAI